MSLNLAKRIGQWVYAYIRIGMFSVKTPQGTPLRLITSSSSYFFLQVLIAIKQRWLTLDRWACPPHNNPKDSGGVKKTTGWKKNRKNFMAPFNGWGSTASRLKPLWGGSLLFTTKFPEIPGTHFIDLRRMKGWVDLGATQWFWTWDSWIENPAHQPLGHWG